MFFTSISQMMTESVDLTLVIRKANGQLTVSTLPKANGLKDEAANHIIPLTLTGTPEEMDAEFLQHIMQPIRKATGLISNLMEFEKQADDRGHLSQPPGHLSIHHQTIHGKQSIPDLQSSR